jgi:dolichol-phosphate mannosyltransferase
MPHRETQEMSRALVVVPTYNERETIAAVAHRLFAAAGNDVELLVVDDGSPDGTATEVRALRRSLNAIHLIEREARQGLGTAYVTAFRWALDRGYRAVVEMDGDLSHNPADVPRLLRALEVADLAIGSRYADGGIIADWGRLRRLLSQGANLYARVWLSFGVKDSTSGFRAYSRSALAAQDLDTIRSEGYAFQIEMTRRVWLARGRVVEVPITFTDRTRGHSKLSRRVVAEALVSVTHWGLQDRITRLFQRFPGGRTIHPTGEEPSSK